MSLARTFENFIRDLKNKDAMVQICLTGGGPMAGTIEIVDGDDVLAGDVIYRILCEAQLGPSTRVVKLPFTFAGSSVVWFSTGPIVEESGKILGALGS